MQLEALVRPKSVAILGASDKPTIGRRLLISLARIGFKGAVYPVNPNTVQIRHTITICSIHYGLIGSIFCAIST